MNLSQLRGFVYTAQTGSITKGAKKAFVSQPAMTKMIKELEEELGVQLFSREGRRIYINEYGKLFLTYIEKGLDQIDYGVNAVLETSKEKRKPIRILVEVGSLFIPEILHALKTVYLDTPIQLTQKIVDENDFQKFDFVISTTRNSESIELLEEEIFVGTAGDELTSNIVSIQDLMQLPIIGLSNQLALRKTLDTYFNEYKLNLEYQYESDDPATIRELIDNHAGVSFIPAITWAKNGENLHLARIYPNSPTRTVYLSVSAFKSTETKTKQKAIEVLRDLFKSKEKLKLLF
ncbi:LysR family transcriptional regulator [Ligilactobacillus sp. WILCCON 0076]|uniref:LysR family transcriptional regulator n=1 Tax=Ligilactobacillus ubinensis TaxID=2876789 RepID=A0A9X2FLE9_9LACO|nr:LysR family transcriptional regulator [Ligilactobacillus ubinensis]MCP0887771.1 LysR family transcriptional regulator [Ligilactobacillus ubinensis]